MTDSRDPERHLFDAAVLLACIDNPIAKRESFAGSDRSRMLVLERELVEGHRAWLRIPVEDARRGRAVLRALCAVNDRVNLSDHRRTLRLVSGRDSTLTRGERTHHADRGKQTSLENEVPNRRGGSATETAATRVFPSKPKWSPRPSDQSTYSTTGYPHPRSVELNPATGRQWTHRGG